MGKASAPYLLAIDALLKKEAIRSQFRTQSMMPKTFFIVKIKLGLKGLDPATCFERLAGEGGRGYLIEKIEDGRRRAWIGVQPFETLRVIQGRVYSVTARRKKNMPGEPFAVIGKRLGEYKGRGGGPLRRGRGRPARLRDDPPP